MIWLQALALGIASAALAAVALWLLHPLSDALDWLSGTPSGDLARNQEPNGAGATPAR